MNITDAHKWVGKRTLNTLVGRASKNLKHTVPNDRWTSICVEEILNRVKEFAGTALHCKVFGAVVQHDCPELQVKLISRAHTVDALFGANLGGSHLPLGLSIP